jgi:hypothetical protein
MKQLADLKKRLEALPERRKGSDQRALFDQFLSKATTAKEHLVSASNGVAYAAPVLPSSEYDVARRAVRSSARISKNLADKLRRDANTISDRATQESFSNLTDKARGSLGKITSGWQDALRAQIEKWELIADVIAQIGSGSHSLSSQATRLKSAINSLRLAKESLPQTQKAGEAVKENLDQLADSVSKLGLDTPFGKFLQAAASGEGAPLGDVHDKSVAQQIESLKLSGVFRVRLSS